MTETVVRAVADATGRSPMDLTPLYEAIDPDALEAVVRSGGDERLRVTFSYQGCRLSVDGTGAVTVEPSDATGPTVERTDPADTSSAID